jgi:hypothetical protein
MPSPSILETPAGREILRYLAQNPEANDTVEGIVEWWLLEQRINHSVAEVTAVLAEFRAQGLIVARQGLDGRTHYRVDAKKGRKILNLINAS